MAELVQDIVQKFKLDAARLGITLEIDIEKTTALVSADIGMLDLGFLANSAQDLLIVGSCRLLHSIIPPVIL